MKKIYEGMEFEIIRFTAEDIITASVEMEDDGGTGSDSSSGDSGDDTGTVHANYGDYNFHSCPLLFVIKFHASLL